MTRLDRILVLCILFVAGVAKPIVAQLASEWISSKSESSDSSNSDFWFWMWFLHDLTLREMFIVLILSTVVAVGAIVVKCIVEKGNEPSELEQEWKTFSKYADLHATGTLMNGYTMGVLTNETRDLPFSASYIQGKTRVFAQGKCHIDVNDNGLLDIVATEQLGRTWHASGCIACVDSNRNNETSYPYIMALTKRYTQKQLTSEPAVDYLIGFTHNPFTSKSPIQSGFGMWHIHGSNSVQGIGHCEWLFAS